jgi:hypothetical protein
MHNNTTISNTNRSMHKLRARNKKNAIKAVPGQLYELVVYIIFIFYYNIMFITTLLILLEYAYYAHSIHTTIS